MTQEQELDMRNWAGGDASCECDSMVTVIYPEAAKRRWETSNSNGCVLANADNYWTKAQVEKRIQQMSGTTPEEVEEIVKEVAYTKEQTNSLLDRYLTKMEANGMFANYSKVEDTTLVLNADNITI